MAEVCDAYSQLKRQRVNSSGVYSPTAMFINCGPMVPLIVIVFQESESVCHNIIPKNTSENGTV